uniref:Rab-GAP TBC domain-containing protein n=1 Tax=Timema cristinae TaxID=61476 RepID=A0A7R9CBN7_TIMCR|nr:unnamed protein product [Timema cristinae]
MAGIFGYSREAIRVKVTKCEGVLQPEHRKFSVDPQITSFEVLQSILAKAFDIKGEFTVCYRTFDDYGQETYLSLLSDWDLDAAFLSASDPCLGLQVDLKPFEESCDEWDMVGCVDTPRPISTETKLLQNRLPGLILNQVERTFNMVQRALNLVEDQPTVSSAPPRSPLTDAEFRRFLDPIGQVVQTKELRTVIYLGGIEPSLRKVVWKHILNVYPDVMSGKERMDYMKKKAYEYQELRDKWRDIVQRQGGQVTGDLAYVTSMVRKDVLRTDRHHRFYAGSDDNQNIASLFNILTTYALNHPSVSYCQGMSDLASPLLVTMGDEAHAYICFCALMRRLKPNFLLDGITMTLKFQHLAEGLMYYDPEFYSYLKSHQADDLLFCYRWLLLEMKREFAFEDALRMLEVLWSSLPQVPPQDELPLFEREFYPHSFWETPPPLSPLVKTPRENAYTKVCALRRQSSAASLHSFTNLIGRKTTSYRQNQSLDETIIGRPHANVLKEQSKVKTFSSLDDASIQLLSHENDSKSCLIFPCDDISEPDNDETIAINNHINKSNFHSNSLVISNVIDEKNQCKEFNEKIMEIHNRNKLPPSELIQMDDCGKEVMEQQHSPDKKSQVRVVKNLNEFLSFTGVNKNKFIHDKLVSNNTPQKDISSSQIKCNDTHKNDRDNPIITLTESSFEEFGIDSDHDCLKKDKLCDDVRQTKCDGENDDTILDNSSPDDSTDYFPMTTSMTRELRLDLENLDRQVFGSKFSQHSLVLDDSEELESPCSESFHSVEVKIEQKCDCVLSKHESELPSEETTTEVAEICTEPQIKLQPLLLKLDRSWPHGTTTTESDDVDHSCEFANLISDGCTRKKVSGSKLNRSLQQFSPGLTLGAGEEIFVWENPLQCPTTPDEQADLEYDGSVEGEGGCSSTIAGEIFENEGQGVKSVTPIRLLRHGLEGMHSFVKSSLSDPPVDDGSDSSDGLGGGTTPIAGETNNLLAHLKGSIKSDTLSTKRRGSKESCPPVGTSMTNSCEEVTESVNLRQTNSRLTTACSSSSPQLPPPQEFGGGNPFLMFLCLTVLCQHRDFVMRSCMDYNEMAMHFDKMVRKHNVTRVLNQARHMYADYLRQQALNNNSMQTSSDLNV